MKYITLLMTGFLSSGCAFATPLKTEFTVRVKDAETGLPVTNAIVQSYFTQKYDPWGEGVGKRQRFKDAVDKNGLLRVEGTTIQEGAGATTFSDSHYSGSGWFSFSGKNSLLGRWEPWNPTIEVMMRPKKNPVPMVHREGHWSAFKVPVYNEPLGYDLERMDYVSPHGKGSRSDLYLNFTRIFENSQNFNVSCELTFPKEHDGIQEFFFDEAMPSSYRWPYLAPTNGYKTSILWQSSRKNAGETENNFNDDVNYIFRVRTETDSDGNIISACYGKIAGPFKIGWADWINWTYWFNPVPNERSLEWSGINLYKRK